MRRNSLPAGTASQSEVQPGPLRGLPGNCSQDLGAPRTGCRLNTAEATSDGVPADASSCWDLRVHHWRK